jgi:hypothetical protein
MVAVRQASWSSLAIGVDGQVESCYTVVSTAGFIVGGEGARAMKRCWRRGVLLAVSLGLLLGGAGALAAGLDLTVDQLCFECYPGTGDPPEEYIVRVVIEGYDPGERMVHWIEANGEHFASWSDYPELAEQRFSIAAWCDGGVSAWRGHGPPLSSEDVPPWLQEKYGEWSWSANQPDVDLSGSVAFVLAEDCAAYEFVPEPGSLLLLSSGLIGLAGYASLRWRTRE